MSFRATFKAFIIACVGIVAGASGAETSIPSTYYIKGGSTPEDLVRGRAATKELQDALTRSALRGIPTRIFLSGFFLLDAPIVLTSANAKTILSGFGSQGAFLLPQQPMFATIRIDRTSEVTIKNLSISGSSRNGVYAKDSPKATISGLTVVNTASNGWSQGAIHLTGMVAGAVIAGNTIEHSGFGGIVVDTTENSDVSDVRIINNVVTDSCYKVNDCGAIYINDRGRRSTGIVISRNRVNGFGGAKVNGRAIYIDDWASNVTVAYNTIGGAGNYAFHIHGGHDNIIKNNTVKLEGIASVLRYGRATDGTMADMTGNVLTGNTFIAGSKDPLSQFSSEYRVNAGKIGFAGNKICRFMSCKTVQ